MNIHSIDGDKVGHGDRSLQINEMVGVVRARWARTVCCFGGDAEVAF
jgi:hypothetical protein